MASRDRSEHSAWEDVLQATDNIRAALRNNDPIAAGRMLATLAKLAQRIRRQLDRGVHTNPFAALIVPNPPHASDWSDRVYGIQYRHKQDGDDYEHDFARGVCLRANQDGSVTLYRRDGRPVWEEFSG